MKRICEGKLFDTDKAEVIFGFNINVQTGSIVKGLYYNDWHYAKLCLSPKGAWFRIVSKHPKERYAEKWAMSDSDKFEIQTEDEVRYMFTQLNKIELYEKYFEKLQET